MVIRKAELKDLEQLLEIYNYEVINGISTLDLEPKTLEERKEWFYEHNIDHHPLYVAELDGHIAGYASLSTYRQKEAYKTTAELSVYVGLEDRKKGVAKALITYLLDEAKKDDTIHTIVSVITDGNDASIKLHQDFEFEYCGTIKEVGIKFGRFLDIVNYRLSV